MRDRSEDRRSDTDRRRRDADDVASRRDSYGRSARPRSRSPSPRPRPRPRAEYVGVPETWRFKHWQRPELYVMKCVDLEQYRGDYAAGRYARLTSDQKMDMFGSRTMPIFVPLARGETKQQFEDRFLDWLHAQNRTLEGLRASTSPYTEREYRVEFANMARERKSKRMRDRSWSSDRSSERSAKKVKPAMAADEDSRRGHGEKETSSRRSSLESRKSTAREGRRSRRKETTRDNDEQAAPPPRMSCVVELPRSGGEEADKTAIVAAYLDCGCTSCLFGAMGQMAEQVAEIEDQAASFSALSSSAGRNHFVDLTHEDDHASPRAGPQASPKAATD